MGGKRKCAAGCSTYTRLFSFPKDGQSRMKWLQTLGLLHLARRKFLYLCSRHFSKDMFGPKGERIVSWAMPNNSVQVNRAQSNEDTIDEILDTNGSRERQHKGDEPKKKETISTCNKFVMATNKGIYCLKSEDLIHEIEIRPVLWDKSCILYGNKEVWKRQWNEVCDRVMHRWNWEEMDEDEKLIVKALLKEKWTEFVTLFKKTAIDTLDIDDDERIYLPQTLLKKLNFLLSNYLYKSESCASAEGSDDDDDILLTNQKPTIRYEVVSIRNEEDFDIISDDDDDDAFSENEMDSSSSETDKEFLLSLLPAFKKFTPNQKLQVKEQFLHIVNQSMFESFE